MGCYGLLLWLETCRGGDELLKLLLSCLLDWHSQCLIVLVLFDSVRVERLYNFFTRVNVDIINLHIYFLYHLTNTR